MKMKIVNGTVTEHQHAKKYQLLTDCQAENAKVTHNVIVTLVWTEYVKASQKDIVVLIVHPATLGYIVKKQLVSAPN